MFQFTPEPYEALKTRFHKALTAVDILTAAAILTPNHIFDTEMGFRICISLEHWPNGTDQLHISASLIPGENYVAARKQFWKDILEAGHTSGEADIAAVLQEFKKISGYTDTMTVGKSYLSPNSVVHIWVALTKSESAPVPTAVNAG